LTERWYAWEDARKIAATDPEVNLAPQEDEPAYVPSNFEVSSIMWLSLVVSSN